MPAADAGRALGGHLYDEARGGEQRQLARVHADRERAREGRAAAALLRLRAAAIEIAIERLQREREGRAAAAAVLEAALDGKGLSQAKVGALIGRGRQWINRAFRDLIDGVIVDGPDLSGLVTPEELEAALRRALGGDLAALADGAGDTGRVG